MTDIKLTAKQTLFVKEYLVDMNATQAAIRAGYSAKTAHSIGDENLRKPAIAAAIDIAIKERSERTEITQDMVLKRWWAIATADPRKLIQYIRCSCRWCHGVNHEYQWKDEQEFIKAYNSAVALVEAEPDGNHPIPDNLGGYGYNPTITPHPECPQCFGQGRGEVDAHDTRNIDEQTAMLYAGVKVTKEGLEIKMQDQAGALENVAKHLGMFIDRSEQGKPGDFDHLKDDELERRLKQAEDAIRLAESTLRTAATPTGKAQKVKS